MATLSIRNLPDDVHAQLRMRAARHGRSMEAEAREILTSICSDAAEPAEPADLQRLVDSLYQGRKPTRVVDAFLAERRAEADRE